MKLYRVLALEKNNRKSVKNRKVYGAIIMASSEEDALKMAHEDMSGNYIDGLMADDKLRIEIYEVQGNIYTTD